MAGGVAVTDPQQRRYAAERLLRTVPAIGDRDRAARLTRIIEPDDRFAALDALRNGFDGGPRPAEHDASIRRRLAELLSTPSGWHELDLVAQVDPPALRTVCDALLER